MLDGDEDGKGKGKKGDACLNVGMTKRKIEQKSVGFGLFPPGTLGSWMGPVVFFTFSLWNVVFQPECGPGVGTMFLTLDFSGDVLLNEDGGCGLDVRTKA